MTHIGVLVSNRAKLEVSFVFSGYIKVSHFLILASNQISQHTLTEFFYLPVYAFSGFTTNE